MTKESLISEVAKASGIEVRAIVERAVNAVFEVITAALARKEDVKLSGFGSFKVKRLEARKGVNPKTKEPITIAARNTVKFRAGKELKEAVKMV